MAWTSPRTWVYGELVTMTMLNTHLRDNVSLLKTHLNNLGNPRPALKTFGTSVGQANAAGGGDTQLTNYDVTIPAGTLANPGDAITVEGTYSLGATAGTFTGKMQVASGTLVTLFSIATTNSLVHFRYLLKRRASNTGAMTGAVYSGAFSGVLNPYLLHSALGTVDWTVDQTLKHFAAHGTANMVLLFHLGTQLRLSTTGATV